MPDTFRIEEDISSNAQSVELSGSDMPLGRPRGPAAFNTGGEVQLTEIYLSGRRKPIYQVHQARQKPLVVRGAFRDHLFIRDGGDEGTFHAQSMRSQIEAIRARANPLRITWGNESFQGVLKETDFGVENDANITYELTFAIAVGPDDAQVVQDDTRNQRQDTSDVTAQVQELLAERQAELDALYIALTASATLDLIQSQLTTTSTAVADVQSVAKTMEGSAQASIAQPAAALRGAVQIAQTNVSDLVDVVSNVDPTEIATTGDPDILSAAEAFLIGLEDDLVEVADQLRTVAYEALRRTQRTIRLYVVRAGDTLESIARQQLGDASRAGELGVLDSDLVAGRVIRIPNAA